MFQKHPKPRMVIYILLTVVLIAAMIFAILLPFIFDALYSKESFESFFTLTDYIGDALTYYGGLFAVVATIILGGMTYRQTQIAQKKSDELSELQSQILKQMMNEAKDKREREEKAEQDALKRQELEKENFEREKQQHEIEVAKIQATKIEIGIATTYSYYSNMSILIKNHNSQTIGNFQPIELAFFADGSQFEKATSMKVDRKFISSEERAILRTTSPELVVKEKGTPGNRRNKPYKNVTAKFSFSYIDENGKQRFCEATTLIQSTDKFEPENWLVKNVG